MRIPAKFNGRCAQCGHAIKAGDEIDYIDKKAYHPQCAPEKDKDDYSINAGAESLCERLGFIKHGEPIPAWWLSGDRPVRDLSEAHRGDTAGRPERSSRSRPESDLFGEKTG